MNFRVKFQNQANKSVKLHDKYLEEKQLNSEKRKLEKFEKQKAKKIESVKAGEKVKLLLLDGWTDLHETLGVYVGEIQWFLVKIFLIENFSKLDHGVR